MDGPRRGWWFRVFEDDPDTVYCINGDFYQIIRDDDKARWAGVYLPELNALALLYENA